MNACLRTALIGFIAGALSVLVFHQLGFWIANELGYARAPLYSLRPVPPFDVPAILSLAFWGGLWGMAAAFLVPRLPGLLDGVLGWILFAAIVVTLVNWFVVCRSRARRWVAASACRALSWCRWSMRCGASACG